MSMLDVSAMTSTSKKKHQTRGHVQRHGRLHLKGERIADEPHSLLHPPKPTRRRTATGNVRTRGQDMRTVHSEDSDSILMREIRDPKEFTPPQRRSCTAIRTNMDGALRRCLFKVHTTHPSSAHSQNSASRNTSKDSVP